MWCMYDEELVLEELEVVIAVPVVWDAVTQGSVMQRLYTIIMMAYVYQPHSALKISLKKLRTNMHISSQFEGEKKRRKEKLRKVMAINVAVSSRPGCSVCIICMILQAGNNLAALQWIKCKLGLHRKLALQCLLFRLDTMCFLYVLITIFSTLKYVANGLKTVLKIAFV